MGSPPLRSPAGLFLAARRALSLTPPRRASPAPPPSAAGPPAPGTPGPRAPRPVPPRAGPLLLAGARAPATIPRLIPRDDPRAPRRAGVPRTAGVPSLPGFLPAVLPKSVGSRRMPRGERKAAPGERARHHRDEIPGLPRSLSDSPVPRAGDGPEEKGGRGTAGGRGGARGALSTRGPAARSACPPRAEPAETPCAGPTRPPCRPRPPRPPTCGEGDGNPSLGLLVRRRRIGCPCHVVRFLGLNSGS
eukprot:6518065-Pyramimonas_sp.AAC.2